MSLTVLGLDIGGANLKAADNRGNVRMAPFALWKQPSELSAALKTLTADWTCDRLAVTMTGELCDCFETKREGVRHILQAVAAIGEGRPVDVWTMQGRFFPFEDAVNEPLFAAAANWLALATFAGRFVPDGAALMIDVGSTTTDIVPILDGHPAPAGRTDTTRLQFGELVYTGWRRTPVCAILGLDGMAEFFATSHDVSVLLDHVPESETDRDTADGRPATKQYAHARMARMLGGDSESVTLEQAMKLADTVFHRQVAAIGQAVHYVAKRFGPPKSIVVSGSGRALGKQAAERCEWAWSNETTDLADFFGPELSSAACAYAVAKMCAEDKR